MKTKINRQRNITIFLALLLGFVLLSVTFLFLSRYYYRQPVEAVAKPSPYIEELEMDTFENKTEGYRFNYPRGWRVELRDGKVRLESDLGVIFATVIDNQLELGYEPKDSESATKLEKVGVEIRESFELIEAKSFDKDYVRQRYMEIEASNSGNY